MVTSAPESAISAVKKKQILKRISTARLTVASFCRFFGHLIGKTRTVVAEPEHKVPTAAVSPDGYIYYNPDYVDSLSDAELAGLVIHETLHPALLCWRRQGSRKQMCITGDGQVFSLWNLCFPAGTYITGAGPIEEIGLGQTVTTMHGSAPAYQAKRNPYSDDLISVRAVGMIPFETTRKHPVLVATRKGSLKKYPIRLSEPEWIDAEDIEPRRHYLVVPRPKAETDVSRFDLDEFTKHGRWGRHDLPHNRKLRNGLPLTMDTAWAMGLYVANGCKSNGIRWTLNVRDVHKRDRLIQTFSSFGFKVSVTLREDVNAVDVTVTSSILARFFASMFGRRAAEKRIPDCILFHENLFFLGEFLQGYMAGDGHVTKKDVTIAATVSDDLIRQIQLAYARMGVLSKVYRTKQQRRQIRGHWLPEGEIWTTVIHKGYTTPRTMQGRTIQCSTKRWKTGGEFILTPVTWVGRRQFTGDVYNIATPDHTYAVNNAIVHNCHDLSFNPEIIALATKCRAKGKITLPKDAVLETQYEGWSAERIYDDKLKTMKESKDGSGCSGGVGEAIGTYASGIGDDLRPDLSKSETGKRAARGDKTAEQKLANDWRVSVIAAAMAHERKYGRGHLPGGLQKLVGELRECKVDWRDVLSQWIGENGNKLDFTMRRPRRRFDPNVLYLPSYQKHGIDDVVVLWDTSGSMSGRETSILSELINGICEDLGLRLRVICIDSKIHSDTRDVEEACDMIGEIKGGGGSNFCPAFDLLEKEQFSGVVIAFTDGHIGVPTCPPALIKDTLWCIEPSKGGFGDVDPTARMGNSPWGQVLVMDD